MSLTKTNFIGMLYKPTDNSYSVNLTSSAMFPYKNEGKYLAGNLVGKEAVEVKIISNPFSMKVIINSSLEEKKNDCCRIFI